MIDGTYSIVYLDYGEGFLPIAVETGSSFEEGVNQKSTTVRDNNGWATQVLTNQFYNFSVNGLAMNTVYAKGDFTRISYDRLERIKRSKEIVNWKKADKDNIHVQTGQCQIISLSKNDDIGEFVSFEASFLGYGKPESSTGKHYPIENGLGELIEDGNNNNIES